MLRSVLAAAFVLLSAQTLAAQAATRAVVVPQVGGMVSRSLATDATAMASLVVEVPVHSAWSLTAEGTSSLGKYVEWACQLVSEDECIFPTSLRTGAAAGIVAHPLRIGPLAPYAGASAGFVQWKGNGHTGVAPMASLRVGLDLQGAGVLGLRAELVRRIAWASTPDAWPLRADVFSLGARVAIRR